MKKLAIIFTLIFMVCLIRVAPAQETIPYRPIRHRPPVALMILDLVIIRPISASVAISLTGFCISTMPLAYTVGIGEQSARVLVEAPWRFTGMRRLGEFADYKDGKPITIVERP